MDDATQSCIANTFHFLDRHFPIGFHCLIVMVVINDAIKSMDSLYRATTML